MVTEACMVGHVDKGGGHGVWYIEPVQPAGRGTLPAFPSIFSSVSVQMSETVQIIKIPVNICKIFFFCFENIFLTEDQPLVKSVAS